MSTAGLEMHALLENPNLQAPHRVYTVTRIKDYCCIAVSIQTQSMKLLANQKKYAIKE